MSAGSGVGYTVRGYGNSSNSYTGIQQILNIKNIYYACTLKVTFIFKLNRQINKFIILNNSHNNYLITQLFHFKVLSD